MEQSHQLNLLNKILANQNSEPEIIELISLCSKSGKSGTLALLSSIKSYFTSQSYSSFTRLQCVRVLKSLMQVNKSSIITSVQLEIIPAILNYVLSQRPSEGFSVWIRLLELNDNSEFKAYILLLQCFESWAYYHPSGRHGADSEFLRAFGELCEKNTEFPPSFFLKSFDCEQMPAKRDLKRVERLCEEFLKGLACLNKGKSLILKKVLVSYEKSLKDIAKLRESKAITQLLEKITELLNLFKSIKSNRFMRLPQDQGKLKLTRLIDDPTPKCAPGYEIILCKNLEGSCNEDEEIMKTPRGFHQRSCTSRCLSNHSKANKYKEKNRLLKEKYAELQNKFSILAETNSKFVQENEAINKYKNELDAKYLVLEGKFTDIQVKIELKNNEIKLLEKQVKSSKEQSEKLKIRNKNLENSYKILLLENENNKKVIKTFEFENLHPESKIKSHRPRETEVQVNSKNISSKRILAKARAAAINLKSPHFSYLPQKDSNLYTISDSESERYLGDEISDLIIPNISLDLTEKYYSQPHPSKSSRQSKSNYP